MPFYHKIRQNLTGSLINLPGWHTHRKIVVIESDDWGSIRMPSKNVFDRLLNKGYTVHDDPYMRYDSLASEGDLSALFDVLTQVKDKFGNYAKITANSVVANPDFDKIEKSGFSAYFYEPFYKTLERYPKHQRSLELWKEGTRIGIFKPQFHGREHLNVRGWLKDLQSNNKHVLDAFKDRMLSISSEKNNFRNNYMEAFGARNDSEENSYHDIIETGLNLFKDIHGFSSDSFIAPCYTWPVSLEQKLFDNEVNILQGIIYQSIPNYKNEKFFYTKKKHFSGSTNKLGQVYLTRNCHFEPSQNGNIDWVNLCLKRICNAFFWKKPAIISMHRLNFIGFINENNRTRNLGLFLQLLKAILKNQPDVEFLSSDELGNLILKSRINNE